MAVTKVLGLDISLASTGVACLHHVEGARWDNSTYTVPTARMNDTSSDLLRRYEYLADYLAPAIRQAHLIVIESPAFRSSTAQAHALAGAWWSVYRQAERSGGALLEVAPTQVKKYASGSGSADKAMVGVAVGRMWPEAAPGNNNEIDALVLASIGADYLGLGVPYNATKHRQEIIRKLGG